MAMSLVDWQTGRARVLAVMQEVMGPLPGPEKRCALDVRIEEEADAGSHLRQLISYAPEPGSRTPAYLLIPKDAIHQAGRRPAVLCLHPTNADLGHKVVVGLGDGEDRSYASQLADRGFVTLAPAYPLLANYHPDLEGLGYASGTMKAIWDNMRGLDLLESLPRVRPRAFGVIGHSLGGHNGIYTAVFEPRIQAVVSSCGFDSYRDYMDGDITGWTSSRYMPRLKDYALPDIPFDFHDLIAALAPRHCFVSAPLHDANFRHESVAAIVAEASKVYRLHDASAHLTVRHPDCGHAFPADMRALAYELFDRVLNLSQSTGCAGGNR